jgi:tetratricopeptide (TPR) repeat protein
MARNAFRRSLSAVGGAALVAALLLGACGGDDSDSDQAATATELVEQGLAAHNAGDTEEAADLYRQALDEDDRNQYALYNLGLIAQTEDDNEQAEQRYRAALEVDPNFTPALFNLAIIRSDAEAYDEAQSLYEQVISIDPDNASAHLNLGFLLTDQLDDADGGQEELDRAVELDPTLESRIPGEGPSDTPDDAQPEDTDDTTTTS